jgi:hypothetical protein
MGEFLIACAGGIIVSIFNKFVMSGYIFQQCIQQEEEDDGLSSQSSTISADVHEFHVHHT